MDAAAFDRLSRAVSVPGARRRLLGLLAALSLLGWLAPEDSAAKDHRRRRKGRHKQKQSKAKGQRQRQRNKRACKPQGKAITCAGQCGPITTRKTCGKTVDCGSCDCPTPCGECLICQSGPNTPGACVPDPAQMGEPCGSAGQVCQSSGVCACAAGTCANPAPICASGACAACTASSACVAAGLGGVCCAGSCYDGVCCGAGDCLAAGAPDCVGHDCVCPSNGDVACAGDATCCPDGCFDLQTDPDHCGACQTACANPTPACVGGACASCTANSQCPVCQVCEGGQCVADASLQHTCTTPCPSGEWCDAGACAAIQATVRLPDCQSVCGGSMEVCGQTVTCPPCNQCMPQTGCAFNSLADGPAGSALYCSLSSLNFACSTNAECASAGPFAYCNSFGDCARICPF